MEEPWENLSSGLVAAAADAKQGVKNHGQPTGRGHKLWSSLQRQVSEEYRAFYMSCTFLHL